MRVLRNLLLVALAGVAAFAGFAATRPADFHVERATKIDAPREVVFPLVNDLRAWGRWSPFERDPEMTKEFAGAASGEGAIYRWSGNADVGRGQATITASVPNELVALRLEFFEPMRATDDVRFVFEPSGGGTRVAWEMDGRNGFVGKALSVFFDVDEMVGGSFEAGLAAMKQVAETRAAAGGDG
jgi:uncharacterized protein YndB with AHSA1/START domain